MTPRPLTTKGALRRCEQHGREAAAWATGDARLAWPRALQVPGLCAALDALQLELGDDEGERQAVAAFCAALDRSRRSSGRRPLVEGEPTCRLSVIVPESTRAQLGAAAESAGVPIAEVLRRIVEAHFAGAT